MRRLSVAVTQMACGLDRAENVRRACALVEEAAGRGAQVVLLQELFETPYFCIDVDPALRGEATSVAANPAIAAMRRLAARLGVVVPVSFYERADDGRRFNSLAIVDADGDVLGVYRKSHIPDFPAYEEAFYFDPGDTGFLVWETRHGRIGCGICWDQWFPEAARLMAVAGAELLLYPTAIGRPLRSADEQPADSRPHWQRTMQGHAAANQIFVAASNRIGAEAGRDHETLFYGGSFVADPTGDKILEMDEEAQGVAVATLDLDAAERLRKLWGIYRTRRLDLYPGIATRAAPAHLMTR